MLEAVKFDAYFFFYVEQKLKQNFSLQINTACILK